MPDENQTGTDSTPVGVVSLNDLALTISELTSRSIKQLVRVSNGQSIEEAVTGGCTPRNCGCDGSDCPCNSKTNSVAPSSIIDSFLKERESSIAELKSRIEALEAKS